MEKVLRIGRASASGSLLLFMGHATSTAIAAAGTIILARVLQPAEYGLYTIALIPSLMIGLFQDWGIGSAMTKYIAKYRAADKDDQIHGTIVAGLLFKMAAGLALSFLSLLLANFIASTIFQRPESTPLVSIASIAIFSNSLLIASQSNFTGFERMEFSSITMICQSMIKSVASPLLVLIGYGALGAVLGHTLSALVAGVIGLSMLYLMLFRRLKRTSIPRPEISKNLKTMLHFGVPLSISTILAGFLVQFYGFMMALFCSDVVIGNYQVAANFSVVLSFLTFPIATVLFPAFAKLDSINEKQIVQTVFKSSVKYTAILLVPSTLAVMVLSKPMVSTLFGEKWAYAPLLLSLYVINNLFILFGSLVQVSLLTGLGETKMLMKMGTLTLLLGVALAFLLVPKFGIIGIIVGQLLASLPSMFWGLHWIWKHYQVKADFDSSTRICAASIIAAIIAHFSQSFLGTAEWVKLTIGGIVFLAVYIVAAPLVGALKQSDISNLRVMLSGLGFASKLMSTPLALAERVARIGLARQR